MADLHTYLPMAVSVVEGFRQRFPNKTADGKMDMWPSQALETYQCHDPTSRSSCPANPSTDVGGLMAVLPRLLALPASATTAAQHAAWTTMLAELPPMPVESASKPSVRASYAYQGQGFTR